MAISCFERFWFVYFCLLICQHFLLFSVNLDRSLSDGGPQSNPHLSMSTLDLSPLPVSGSKSMITMPRQGFFSGADMGACPSLPPTKPKEEEKVSYKSCILICVYMSLIIFKSINSWLTPVFFQYQFTLISSRLSVLLICIPVALGISELSAGFRICRLHPL